MNVKIMLTLREKYNSVFLITIMLSHHFIIIIIIIHLFIHEKVTVCFYARTIKNNNLKLQVLYN